MFIMNLTNTDLIYSVLLTDIVLKANAVTYVDPTLVFYQDLKNAFGNYIQEVTSPTVPEVYIPSYSKVIETNKLYLTYNLVRPTGTPTINVAEGTATLYVSDSSEQPQSVADMVILEGFLDMTGEKELPFVPKYLIMQASNPDKVIFSFIDFKEVVSDISKKVYTLSVNPTPANAYVTINTVNTNVYQEWEGSVLNIRVTKEGYETFTDTITLDQDTTITPTLRKIGESFKFTITPNPIGSVVILDGVTHTGKSSTYVTKGNTVSWRVEHEGYIPMSRTSETVDKDIEKEVTLEKIYYFTLNATPNTAEVKLNNQPFVGTGVIGVTYGNTLHWVVSQEGYETQLGMTAPIIADTTLNITLVEELPPIGE